MEKGGKNMAKYQLDMNKYMQLARQTAAEGCVLLKNDKETLPIKKGTKVSVFGRIAFHYYKSGTGSGGLVNTNYVVGILDALKTWNDISINEELEVIYKEWIQENPFDKGAGWGQEPWSQKEMPLIEEVVKQASQQSDMAIVVIGRTAGEDQDTKAEEGSYFLTKLEEEMLEKVCNCFDKVAVLLNVGNIIDMRWVETYQPSAVLYTWQGGQEGGNGVLDVLSGAVSPCGKLTDTIAYEITDYPSTKNFGDPVENYYKEDIYVGYRYFETFAKEKVQYPFGYGLSYTNFQQIVESFEQKEESIVVKVAVKNIGKVAGKEIVELYSSAPQGVLGKPIRELKAFKKTDVLQPDQQQIVELIVPIKELASYDDSGKTGYRSAYVLETGSYEIYVGSDVRQTTLAGSIFIEETTLVEQLEECLAPVKEYQRLKPIVVEGDSLCFQQEEEAVPTRTIAPMEKRKKDMPKEIPYTGDQGYQLVDVLDGKITMETFLAQLTEEDLVCIVHGEGMCSPKVTAGTASAFGGTTKSLEHFGVPVACCADGPSGIRMSCGTTAFSLPNGTAMGCTFNTELIEQLYQMEGLELRKNQIDTLLGPGINIHRNPLNGRNFEYISEDPYVTGAIAVAQIKGMSYAGVTGTLKHFAGNNQEFHRHEIDSIVSERALREIYLKGFEMAVKQAGAYSIMTTYGAVNGIWTAGSYDLNTSILRKEWGYKGIVMTDWWAKINEEGEEASIDNTGVMVRAQNDLYMVVRDSEIEGMEKCAMSDLKEGRVTKAEFQQCAKNICEVLMRSPVMDRFLGREEEKVEVIGNEQFKQNDCEISKYYSIDDDTTLDMKYVITDQGNSELFGITLKEMGDYTISAKMRSKDSSNSLAQLSMSIFFDNELKGTFVIQGNQEDWIEQAMPLGNIWDVNHYIKLYFSMSGMELESIRFQRQK